MKRLTITTLLAAALTMPVHALDYFNFKEPAPTGLTEISNTPKKNVKLALYSPDTPDGAIVDVLPPIHEPIDPIKVRRSLTERKKIESAIIACEAAKSLTLREILPPDANKCIMTKLTYYIPMWNNDTSNCTWEEKTSNESLECPIKVSEVG